MSSSDGGNRRRLHFSLERTEPAIVHLGVWDQLLPPGLIDKTDNHGAQHITSLSLRRKSQQPHHQISQAVRHSLTHDLPIHYPIPSQYEPYDNRVWSYITAAGNVPAERRHFRPSPPRTSSALRPEDSCLDRYHAGPIGSYSCHPCYNRQFSPVSPQGSWLSFRDWAGWLNFSRGRWLKIRYRGVRVTWHPYRREFRGP